MCNLGIGLFKYCFFCPRLWLKIDLDQVIYWVCVSIYYHHVFFLSFLFSFIFQRSRIVNCLAFWDCVYLFFRLYRVDCIYRSLFLTSSLFSTFSLSLFLSFFLSRSLIQSFSVWIDDEKWYIILFQENVQVL